MSTREALIEQGVAAILPLYIAEDQAPNAFDYVLVGAVLDAILPQIWTEEELEALPDGTRLVESAGGQVFIWENDSGLWTDHGLETDRDLKTYGPLTVVWRPS